MLFAAMLSLAACGTSQPSSPAAPASQPATQSSPTRSAISPAPPPPGKPSTGPRITYVRFVTPLDGWALTPSSVLRTTNGGTSWTPVTPPSPQPHAKFGWTWSGFFLSPEIAWVVETSVTSLKSGALYKTTDGGETWSGVSLPVGGSVSSIQFLTTEDGAVTVLLGAWAGGCAVAVLRTTDGGSKWTVVARTQPQTPTLRGQPGCGDASFADSTNGWETGATAGNSVLLFHSTDGGKTWLEQPIAIPKGFSAAEGAATSSAPIFFGSEDGVLPVSFRKQGFDLYRTSDRGTTWSPSTPVHFVSTAMFPAYSIIDVHHAVVTGGEEIYTTADGGTSWRTIQPNMSLAHISEIDFVDPSNGWALVPAAGSVWNMLLITHDGGAKWKQLN